MTKITLPAKRQVGHLTLLRQGRKISLAEYNALTSDEQQSMIHNARGREKYDLLINSKYVEKLVPQLHPQELYLTINELGAEYAVELLALASPEQMTLLLDLDCWDGDNLSEVLSLTWLQLLLGCGDEKVCQLIRQMEPELLALFLKKHLIITRGLEAYDDDDAENAKRLEALYDVQYSSEDAAKIIGALLKIWLEQEQESYLLLMEMIRSENFSVLEEEVYQTRSNRLLDLGIIPALEARSIYTAVNPETFEPGGKRGFSLEADSLQHPAALLACAEPQDLLADILAAGVDHAAACELLFLVNRKMCADQIDLADSHAVADAFQATYTTLNLALEYLAGTDIEKANQIFSETYFIQLFQLGYSLLYQYQQRAKAIAAGTIYAYLDYPELLFIDSLLQQPPAIYHESEDGLSSDLQPISRCKDLEFIEQRLDQIDLLSELFSKKLPFSLPDPQDKEIDPPALSGIFLTAIANRLLDRDFLPTPLDPTELLRLKDLTFSNGEIDDSFAQALTTTILELEPGCRFFMNFCLDTWEQFFLDIDENSTQAPHPGILLLNGN